MVNLILEQSQPLNFIKRGVSLGKAAEIAGVTTIEFKDILADRGIRREVGSRSTEELEKGVELIKRLRR